MWKFVKWEVATFHTFGFRLGLGTNETQKYEKLPLLTCHLPLRNTYTYDFSKCYSP